MNETNSGVNLPTMMMMMIIMINVQIREAKYFCMAINIPKKEYRQNTLLIGLHSSGFLFICQKKMCM